MEDSRSAVPQAVFGDNPGPGSQLNTNPSFEDGMSGWSFQNGAQAIQSGQGPFSGNAYCVLIPDGITQNPAMVTIPDTYTDAYTAGYGTRAAVTPGSYVTFTA